MAAVNPGADDRPVRAFNTFTGDLHDMARWFKACGVTSLAMESTAAKWIPAFEVLEEHGFHVIRVNARYAKNVALKFRTPYEAIEQLWKSKPEGFIVQPITCWDQTPSQKMQLRWRNPERNPYIFRDELRNTVTSRYHDVAMALGQG